MKEIEEMKLKGKIHSSGTELVELILKRKKEEEEQDEQDELQAKARLN